MKPIISAQQLSKTFRNADGTSFAAVSNLTLDVSAGSLMAFLGPNGAGKSTSLRMLTTLLKPSSGRASVCGFDIVENPTPVRAHIGYVGQKHGAGDYYRIRDELISQGAFYGLGRRARRARADELIQILNLQELVNKPAMNLSGGQRRRVDIALGLVPKPRLLFLDEPSTGLDPQSRADLWQHILGLRERYGSTLFLTTHYLEEADQYAERVVIIDRGRIIADDTAARLKTDLAGDRISITLAGQNHQDAEHLMQRVALSPEVLERSSISTADGSATKYVIPVNLGDQVLPHLLGQLNEYGHRAMAAELDRPSLDDVFLSLTGRSLREEQTFDSIPEHTYEY